MMDLSDTQVKRVTPFFQIEVFLAWKNQTWVDHPSLLFFSPHLHKLDLGIIKESNLANIVVISIRMEAQID